MAEMERFSRLRPKSRLRRLAFDTPACGQPSRTALRAARALTLPLPPNKKPRPTGRGFVWRRWRDSNSRRAFDPYTISNRARSTNYATSPRVAYYNAAFRQSQAIFLRAAALCFCSALYRKNAVFFADSFPPAADNNDCMMAKSQKAFRRAALLRSKTALLFCHRFIAMSIGRMMEKSFAAKPVVWQRNQSKPRLISPSDDHDKSAWKKAQRRNGI